MALVLGTNCGFVTTAPTADPSGDATDIDTYARAFKDTAPATAIKITEIGWWCDNATEEANYEVGIYDHNVGDNNPEAVVGTLSQTNAKGTDAGWKRVTGLNIPITGGNIYWIAVQVDNTATATNYNYSSSTGKKQDYKLSQTTLPSPWGNSSGTYEGLTAFYAVWEAAPAPPEPETPLSSSIFTMRDVPKAMKKIKKEKKPEEVLIILKKEGT